MSTTTKHFDLTEASEKFKDKEVILHCENMNKTYPTPNGDYVVLDNFNLKVREGEFLSVIGHSGCGKTTALTMIAGLNDITKGNIYVVGDAIKGTGTDRGVIFQAPSLMPWMSVLQNCLLAANQVYPHASKKEREDICKYYLAKVGLGDSFDKKARDLSQGMKQRVGIARAFVIKPKLLLLDEPFGMLDSLTRQELQDVLLEVWGQEQLTAIMITHDVDEAIYLSDRVIMLTSGPFAKVGDVAHIDLPRPRNRKDLLDHPDYYNYRHHLLDFLEH